MKLDQLCKEFGVELCLFDASNWHSSGFYNPITKVLGVDLNLSEQEQKQVALHELQHKNHFPYQYQLFRERCELDANRNMIHHLLKEELEIAEDRTQFNYLVFMEKYKLKTIADETMVKEEYYNLVSGY
ncbi:ImmA/IrrE family metallo-endopeptidase [Streptococcus suis]|uniref:ImmA/IrrE family metallo-endopeptidase n=1 Tax=Streptococcus suis TaxID=1307 RepID=UPI00160F41C3|nr:ImmA/IrrE family metallo-endopeptidase [Streptococcus suis]